MPFDRTVDHTICSLRESATHKKHYALVFTLHICYWPCYAACDKKHASKMKPFVFHFTWRFKFSLLGIDLTSKVRNDHGNVVSTRETLRSPRDISWMRQQPLHIIDLITCNNSSFCHIVSRHNYVQRFVFAVPFHFGSPLYVYGRLWELTILLDTPRASEWPPRPMPPVILAADICTTLHGDTESSVSPHWLHSASVNYSCSSQILELCCI